MQTLAIELPEQALHDFCQRWKIRELSVFGSALRDDFRVDSDVDFLVRFADGARWSLWDVIRAEEELAQVVGRPVDLVERATVEQSENWIRRNDILRTARVIYGG
jgi:predicted nucleotidyltransferase